MTSYNLFCNQCDVRFLAMFVLHWSGHRCRKGERRSHICLHKIPVKHFVFVYGAIYMFFFLLSESLAFINFSHNLKC